MFHSIPLGLINISHDFCTCTQCLSAFCALAGEIGRNSFGSHGCSTEFLQDQLELVKISLHVNTFSQTL